VSWQPPECLSGQVSPVLSMLRTLGTHCSAVVLRTSDLPEPLVLLENYGAVEAPLRLVRAR